MASSQEIEGEIIMGWADRKRSSPFVQRDAQGRAIIVKTPVGELQGLITPSDLRYVVVQLDAPDPVHPDDWSLSIAGGVDRPMELSFEELRKFPGATVRCVHECSGTDADFFDYLESGGETYGCDLCRHRKGKPNRLDARAAHQGMVSAGEWTGVPLATVLERVGVKPGAVSVLAQGFDRGRPAEWATPVAHNIPDEDISFEKSLPLEKALHPDTLLAWALNGEYIRHIHGGPVRLIVPGWSGNWSIKWLQKLEVLDHIPELYYQNQYFYYGQTLQDPNKEMITAMGVKTLITEPRDDDPPLSRGAHMIRGLAWSGAGMISRVEVSVDGGETWQDAHLERPQERWLWVRWSHLWHAEAPGKHAIMARATDEAGRVQPQIGWNVLRKNFDGIVPVDVEVK